MNPISESDKQCAYINPDSFIYQSSEQYLILCLQICNLIIKNKCDIVQLIDFGTLTSKHSNSIQIANSSEQIEKSLYILPQLLSHLNETECKKYASRESYKLSLFICGVLLCAIIVCLNGITLITIIRSRRLRTISNILIANLSIADFLAGLAFLYPCTLNLLTINALETYNSYLYAIACNVRQYYYLCLVGYSPMITSMLTAVLTLTLLAAEKYISILYPYTYERLIQDRKCLCYLCLILVWTISIFFSLLPMLGWNEHKYSTYRGFNCNNAQSKPCMFERIFTLDYILCFTIICGLCALVMFFMYLRIYLIARGHHLQINQMNQQLNRSLDQRSEINDRMKINSCLAMNKQIIDKVSEITDQENSSTTAYLANSKQKPMLKSPSISSNSSLDSCKLTKTEKKTSATKTKETSTFLIQGLHTRLDRFNKNSYTLSTPVNTSNHVAFSNSSQTIILQNFSTSNSDETLPDEAQQVSNIPRTSSSSGELDGDLVLVSIPSKGHVNNHVKGRIPKNYKSSMKAIKTLLILCMGFYCCWLPLIIYFLTFASKQYDNLTIYILMFIACCNAVIDPLVYAFNNQEFCKALVCSNFRMRRNRSSQNF